MLTSDPANRRISVDAVRSVTHRSFKQRPAPEVGSDSCPEVRLWDVTTPSGVFQSKVVVHRLAEFLLAAEIAFSGLNRGVPKQKLNLFKFSARQMA